MNTPAFKPTGVSIHEAIHQGHEPLKPEWMRVAVAVRLFGIGRSSLYGMISEGKIKSTTLRKRGAVHGIRLISFDSLAQYCERAAAEEAAVRTAAGGGYWVDDADGRAGASDDQGSGTTMESGRTDKEVAS